MECCLAVVEVGVRRQRKKSCKLLGFKREAVFQYFKMSFAFMSCSKKTAKLIQ